MPSARRCTRASKEKIRKKFMTPTMQRVKLWEKKEAQKARALWAMKAAKDRKKEFDDPACEEDISRRNKTRLELWEEHLKKPNCGPGQSPEVRGRSVLKLARGFVEAMACDRVVSDLMLPLWEEVLWSFLDAWGGVCVYAQPPRNGMFQGDTGRMATSFFLQEKEPMVLRELSRLEPSIRPHGELLLLLMQKKPTFVPDSEAFNSTSGDGFLVPEFKDESEASEDDQTDNVSNDSLYHLGENNYSFDALQAYCFGIKIKL